MSRTQAATRAANAKLWERDLTAFLDECTPTMRAHHERNLRRYEKFVRENGAATPKSLTHAHVEAWSEALRAPRGNQGRVYAPATVAAMLSSARVWHKFLARERGYLNPFARADAPKVVASPRELLVLSASEIAALRAVAFPDSPLGARDGALLHLLCATGARSGELLALRPFDVSVRARTVRLGAGETSRVVTLDKAACDALSRYLRLRPALLQMQADELGTRRGRPLGDAPTPQERRLAPLFVGVGGRALWPSQLRLVVSFASREAELPDWVRPQTLRHSLAVSRLGGQSASQVRQELGAKSGAALSRHRALAFDALRQTVNLHPRA